MLRENITLLKIILILGRTISELINKTRTIKTVKYAIKEISNLKE